jgi:hypothetical protein
MWVSGFDVLGVCMRRLLTEPTMWMLCRCAGKDSPDLLHKLTARKGFPDSCRWVFCLYCAGKDRLDLLHNQSTAAFKDATPGGGCDTVSGRQGLVLGTFVGISLHAHLQ